MNKRRNFMEIEYSYTLYFEYYRMHTYRVVLAWLDIRDLLLENEIIDYDEFKKINNLIAWHDNSKINEKEWEAYAVKFFNSKTDVDDKTAEKINKEFKVAWAYHKEMNLHHHQTLKNYKGADYKIHIIDLFCDWIAMGWDTGVSAYKYYQEKKKEIELPLKYRDFLEEVLNLVSTSDCYANGKINSKQESYLINFKDMDYKTKNNKMMFKV